VSEDQLIALVAYVGSLQVPSEGPAPAAPQASASGARSR
jgi:hypothetical protein